VHRRALATAVLAAALVAVLAGCVTQNRPAACDDDATTIEVTVTERALEPNDPAACRGQDVTIVVDSEVDGVIHIHGLDEVVPATTIAAGERETLEFEADRSGQFPIELHPADDPEGVSIGILTLHER
jgi:Cupredoxin-like domain